MLVELTLTPIRYTYYLPCTGRFGQHCHHLTNWSTLSTTLFFNISCKSERKNVEPRNRGENNIYVKLPAYLYYFVVGIKEQGMRRFSDPKI